MSLKFSALCFAACTAALVSWSVPASAVTAIGFAVDAVGSDTKVGVYEDRGIGEDAIKYFIPLKDNNGTYGVGSKCSPTGFGTCSDSGDGGGILTMILKFTPVSLTKDSTLSVVFEDLDLKGANDPGGFLESLNVYKGSTSLTGWITDIDSLLMEGDSNEQILTLALGTLTVDPLYLKLKFKSKSTFQGTNTPEYLIATVVSSDDTPNVVPIPGALPLFVSGLALFGGMMYRRKRREQKSQEKVAA